MKKLKENLSKARQQVLPPLKLGPQQDRSRAAPRESSRFLPDRFQEQYSISSL